MQKMSLMGVIRNSTEVAKEQAGKTTIHFLDSLDKSSFVANSIGPDIVVYLDKFNKAVTDLPLAVKYAEKRNMTPHPDVNYGLVLGGQERSAQLVVGQVVPEVFRGMNAEDVFQFWLKNMLWHERNHSVTVPLIAQGDFEIQSLTKLFRESSVEKSQYLRTAQELAAYLGQIYASDHPKFTLAYVLSFYDYLSHRGPFSFLDKNDMSSYGNVANIVFEEMLIKKFGFNRYILRQSINGNENFPSLGLLFFPISGRDFRNFLPFMGNFILSLSDSQIQESAKVLYEKYFGKMPTINIVIPGEVIQYSKEKFFKGSQKINVVQESLKKAISADGRLSKTELPSNTHQAPALAKTATTPMPVFGEGTTASSDKAVQEAEKIDSVVPSVVPAEIVEEFAQAGGEFNFEDFMKRVNGYYYGHNVKIGIEKGGFDTLARISYFGTVIARQIIEVWARMVSEGKDKDSVFSIVEMGGGNGVLARNILQYLKDHNPELYHVIDYVIVDFKGPLSKNQEENLAKYEALGKVRYIRKSVLDVNDNDLKNIEGVFLSNELADDLPGNLIRPGRNGTFSEAYVRYDGKGTLEKIFRPASLKTKEYLGRKEFADEMRRLPSSGTFLIRPTSFQKLYDMISRSLKRGAVLTIDYGGTFKDSTGIFSGALGREHRWGKIVADLGNGELTSAVIFEELISAGKDLKLAGYLPQFEFINNLSSKNDRDLVMDDELQVLETSGYYALIQTKGIQDNKFRAFKIQEGEKDAQKKLHPSGIFNLIFNRKKTIAQTPALAKTTATPMPVSGNGVSSRLETPSVVSSLIDNSQTFTAKNPIIGNIKVEISNEAIDQGLSNRVIKKILDVVSRKEMHGAFAQGRSFILPLAEDEWFSVHGKVFKAIRIKAATDNGSLPKMEEYLTENQPTSKLVIEDGTIKSIKNDAPRGTAYLEKMIKEFYGMKTAFENDVDSDYPLGVGQFSDLEFKGKKTGFAVIAMQDVNDERITEEVYRKYEKEKGYKSVFHFLAQAMKGAGALVSKLHAIGTTHGNPHPEQFRIIGGDVRNLELLDYEASHMASEMSSKEELAFWVLEDFRRALYAIYGNVYKGRGFRDYVNDYFKILLSELDITDLTPGQEFVYSYFSNRLPKDSFTPQDEKKIFNFMVREWNSRVFANKGTRLEDYLKKVGERDIFLKAIIESAYKTFEKVKMPSTFETPSAVLSKILTMGGTVTLPNVKPGGPDVTLKAELSWAREDETVVEVFIDNEKSGYFTVFLNKQCLQIGEFRPTGDKLKSARHQTYGNKGIADTILNWLSQEAQVSGLRMRNSATKSPSLVHLYRRYFADRMSINGDSPVDIHELIERCGFYGQEIWGYLNLIKSEDGTEQLARLELMKDSSGADRYRVVNVQPGYGFNQDKGVQDVVQIKNGKIFLVKKEKDGNEILAETLYSVGYGRNHIIVEGLPRPQKPKGVSSPDIFTDGGIVTLPNVKPGEPKVTLNFSPKEENPEEDEFLVEVSIEGAEQPELFESLPGFDLFKEGKYLRIDLFYPLGSEGGPLYSDYRNRGIADTIFRFLKEEASKRGLKMCGSATRNVSLVYLYFKYFGDEFKKYGQGDEQYRDLRAFIKEHGFYSHEIWDSLSLREMRN
ncbi:MAG: SAM-dependent methyltransferase, partial [Candidatus Omnitrophica bacterium]|nr:SAM-dependent methyltransferase [Candidatus Omnitrophota bacterium]